MCDWFVGRPPGLVYGMGPVQHGFGVQPPPGLHPQFQFTSRPAMPPSRLVAAAPPRPTTDAAAIQRPAGTEQPAVGQPGGQFVPTQVIM